MTPAYPTSAGRLASLPMVFAPPKTRDQPQRNRPLMAVGAPTGGWSAGENTLTLLLLRKIGEIRSIYRKHAGTVLRGAGGFYLRTNSQQTDAADLSRSLGKSLPPEFHSCPARAGNGR